MSDTVLVAVIGVVGGAVGALLTGLLQHKKVRAETGKVNAEAGKVQAEADKDCADTNEQIRKTVMSLLEPLSDRVTELESELAEWKALASSLGDRVTELEAELADWKAWASSLVAQIKSLGHDPVPFKSKIRRG